MDENCDILLDTKLSLESEWEALTNQEKLWCAVGPITACAAGRKWCPDWPAETWHAKKFSPGWDSTLTAEELPPHTPYKKKHDISLNWNNNNNHNNSRLRGVMGRGGTVKVDKSVVWGWPSTRWGGLSSARLSAVGIHLWCLHLPSPAERRARELSVSRQTTATENLKWFKTIHRRWMPDLWMYRK